MAHILFKLREALNYLKMKHKEAVRRVNAEIYLNIYAKITLLLIIFEITRVNIVCVLFLIFLLDIIYFHLMTINIPTTSVYRRIVMLLYRDPKHFVLHNEVSKDLSVRYFPWFFAHDLNIDALTSEGLVSIYYEEDKLYSFRQLSENQQIKRIILLGLLEVAVNDHL